ncbi:translocation protein SEC66, partial [Phenoliferia sp. Uapishka_3]
MPELSAANSGVAASRTAQPFGNEAPPPSWFGPHKSRDLYISLLSIEPPPPRPILIAALLRRAVDDVKLIWSVRDQKQALTTLLAKGQIGDDTWERFLLAEKELEAEIIEVVGEATAFLEGYGQNIFPLASEMATHEKWKDIYLVDMKKDREAQLARQASGPPSLVLSPTSHLTPSSLTLYPSNPLNLSAVPSDPTPTVIQT